MRLAAFAEARCVTLCACFHELVEEYTRVVEQLEDRKWTMKVTCHSRHL